ncbi:hypothetical protein CUJ83_05880 [Methanocella sp. CWC-04]|uniref:histidine kinase n=1 Tax=Methanooceanicella nereidis TaxID=2052831 RepID=A0AAP2RBM0_9EURY|nr:PAS domain S-box protein [Methanocella sp. CWC-04]MCD1294529.1 hypothetical protein [Methanocella sp. CWC-04]
MKSHEGQDITDRSVTQGKYARIKKLFRERKHFFSRLLNSLDEGILIVRGDRIPVINETFMKIFEIDHRPSKIGEIPRSEIFCKMLPDIRRAGSEKIMLKRTYSGVTSKGGIVTVDVSIGPIDHDGRPCVLCRSMLPVMREQYDDQFMRQTWEDFAEDAPVGIFITKGMKVLYLNKLCAKMLGRKKEDLLGCALMSIYLPEEKEAIVLKCEDAVKSKNPLELEFKVMGGTGEYSWIYLKAIPIFENRYGVPYYQGITIDVSKRRMAEKIMLRRSRQLEVLSYTGQQINKVLKIDVVMRTLVRSAMELTGAESGASGLVSDGKMVFTEYNKKGDILPVHYLFVPGYGVPGLVLETKKPYISNDTGHDPHVIQEIRKELGFYNMVDVPILNRNGDVLGCFEIHNKSGHLPFDDEDVNMLNGLAASAAIALENSGMMNDLEKAEKNLRQTASELQAVLDAFPDIYIRLGKDGTILDYHSGSNRGISSGPDSHIGRKIKEIIPAEVYEKVKDAIKKAYDTGSIVSTEYSTVENGERHVFEARLVPFIEDQILSVIRDITDQKHAEEALRSSEEKFRVLAETVGSAILIFNNDRFCYANPASERITGYGRDELLSMNFWEKVHPLDREMVIERGSRRLRGEDVLSRYQFRIIAKCGEVKWLDVTSCMIKYNNRPSILATCFDITDIKRAQERIMEAERYARSLIEANLDALVTIDRSGLITDVNKATEQLTGFSREELIGTDFSRYFTEPEKAVTGYQMVFTRGIVRDYPLEIRNKDRTVTPVSYNASIYRDSNGTIAGVFASARDLTELKKATEEVERAKDFAELYLDIMSHDINNSNHAGLGFLELAEMDSATSPSQKLYLEKAADAFKSSSEIIESVRKIQKISQETLSIEKIDLDESIKEAIERSSQPDFKQVKIDYRPVQGFCVMANSLLAEVFINLIGNSIKHSQGDVEIYIRIEKELRDGIEMYNIIVEDNGPGIPDSLKPFIFQRFERGPTKARGKGLGLYIVKMLIENMRGEVCIRDRVPGDSNKGSSFIVTLPACEE